MGLVYRMPVWSETVRKEFQGNEATELGVLAL